MKTPAHILCLTRSHKVPATRKSAARITMISLLALVLAACASPFQKRAGSYQPTPDDNFCIVTGRATDEEGLPVSEVDVWMRGTRDQVRTNESGVYFLKYYADPGTDSACVVVRYAGLVRMEKPLSRAFTKKIHVFDINLVRHKPGPGPSAVVIYSPYLNSKYDIGTIHKYNPSDRFGGTVSIIRQ